MSESALVTGASGFVGSHISDVLIERGWRVRCLVRKTSDLRWLSPDRVELVYGDVVDPHSLEKATDGVDVVFHAAGTTRAPDEAAYRRHNTEGTRNVARVAASQSTPPRRVILVSSLAAGGASLPGRPRGEEDDDRPLGIYGRSKLDAERALREQEGKLAWTILRPPAVYGPRDSGFILLARMAARGWIPGVTGPKQPVTVIHGRDLARGVVDAAESTRSVGRVYYLTHPELTTILDMGRSMARAMGKRARSLPLPRAALPGLGWLINAVAGATGRSAPLPEDRLQDLLAPAWTCDPSRAREEFGFEAKVDLSSGIPETVEWYRREGWL
jgi:nucleoside-diphosphate-sugar epimerase